MLAVLAAITSPARAQERVPPRLRAIPEIALPEGQVELVVLVHADGTAEVEACDASEASCASARDAIALAEITPATRDGAPVAGRVHVRLVGSSSSSTSASTPTPTPTPTTTSASSTSTSIDDGLWYRARGVVHDEPVEHAITPREARDAPGTMGDPLRIIETLPGVVPVVSGLPFAFIRGAPPGGTLYLYDDIPMPLLNHIAVGPAVIHPRMLGDIRLFAGASPARYGRHTGGVIQADAPNEQPLTAPHGEAELRLLDVNGYVETPIPSGRVQAAARIGWPGAIAGLLLPGLELFYGDYQLRTTLRTVGRDQLQIVALGSYDRLVFPGAGDRTTLELSFHRLELRYLRALPGDAELLSAVRFGYDLSRSTTGATLAAETGSVAPRLVLRMHGDIWSLRVGADALATFGRPTVSRNAGRIEPISPASPGNTRSVIGAFVELRLVPIPELTLDLGGRIDTWIFDGATEGALDPRARLTWQPIDALALHAAFAVTRQPLTTYVPLPGFTDLVLGRSLQTAIQGEAGARLALPWLTTELTFFAHRYEGILFADFFTLFGTSSICGAGGGDLCSRPQIDATTNGLSYGGELMVRLPDDLPVAGWASYTLAWSSVDPVAGVDLRPAWDVRSVLNVVLRWEIVTGLSLGARLFLRSGSPRGQFYVTSSPPELQRYERELPAYARVDASIAYAWDAGWARLRVVLEWLNATMQPEPLNLECAGHGLGMPTDCHTTYFPLLFAPNLGLRADF